MEKDEEKGRGDNGRRYRVLGGGGWRKIGYGGGGGVLGGRFGGCK